MRETHLVPAHVSQEHDAPVQDPGGRKPGRKFTFSPARVDRAILSSN